MKELTFGEKAVGLTFNPGKNEDVEDIKKVSAVLIDGLNYHRKLAQDRGDGEAVAMFTLAIRKVQEGQMWGVKAITWNLN